MNHTKIDPRKVNIAEKDIEEWLYQNPSSLNIESWVARQLRLPSGIADLVGISRDYSIPRLTVIEVKNVEIDSAALAQVSRYAYDIYQIQTCFDLEFYDYAIKKIVIGKGEPSNKVMAEALALDVFLHTFNIKLSLNVSGYWHFSEEYHEATSDQYITYAGDNIFKEAKETIKKADEELAIKHQKWYDEHYPDSLNDE